MRRPERIYIVIPTYNEKENIKRLIPKIEAIRESVRLNLRIIVVDDASPDGTAEEVERLARKYGNITVIRRPGKLGIGSAYKDGFRAALNMGADIIIEMDADLSHDPKYLPTLIDEASKGKDLVIGSRYISGGSVPGWSFKRELISKVANLYAKTLLGLKPKDVTSGYRAFRAEALMKADYSAVKSEGYLFQVEVVYRFKQKNLRVSEIPISFTDRRAGKSKLGALEILKFAVGILYLFLERAVYRAAQTM